MSEAGAPGLRERVSRMLEMVAPMTARVEGSAQTFAVTLAGTTIRFDDTVSSTTMALEKLATCIESTVAHARARAMVAAADEEGGPVPLWLVSGSSVLAAWIAWSRGERWFCRGLALCDRMHEAPVVGDLDRPTRSAFGQTAAVIRVRAGVAVATRIELAGRLRCTGRFGQGAEFRIAGGVLPETLIAACQDEIGRNDRRRLAEIVGHPFFTATDLELAGIRNDGDAVVVQVASSRMPLAPVPAAAWAAVPRDADPSRPWRMTPREVRALYALVHAGQTYGR